MAEGHGHGHTAGPKKSGGKSGGGIILNLVEGMAELADNTGLGIFREASGSIGHLFGSEGGKGKGHH